MKTIVPVFLFLAVAATSFAQSQVMAPPMRPMSGRPGGAPFGAPHLQKSYSDSTEFASAFKQLFPLVKPEPTVHERAERMLQQQSRSFKARGIDSAKAYDSVMKVVNSKMDSIIIFDAYREEFTAKELKPLVEFFKSAAGKHYLEVEQHIVAARTMAIDNYVSREVQRTLNMMGKRMEMPVGTHPGMKPGMRPGMPMRKPMNAPDGPPEPTTPPAPPTPKQ
ncbi:MAG TPA: DUF2059 domain-containing protein [Candidatus Kapabacteria bacterium]|jgi:hypothetical protein